MTATVTKPQVLFSFTADAKELREAIAAILPATSTKSHPVLGCALIEVEADKAQITGFDLDLAISVSCPVWGDLLSSPSKGQTCLPAKYLADLLAQQEGEIVLEVNDNFSAKLKGQGTFTIQGMDPTDYPEIDRREGDRGTLPWEAIATMAAAAPFVSTDETKQILRGVCCTFQADSMEAAATDGHRLHRVPAQGCTVDGLEDTVLPTAAIKALARLAPKGEDIDVWSGSSFTAEWEGGWLMSRKYEGQYPNYPQLFPDKFKVEFDVNRAELKGCLARMKTVLDTCKKDIIRVNFSRETGLEIRADSPSLGDGVETLPVGMSVGADLAFAMNLNYLLAALNAFSGDALIFHANTATAPFVLTGNGADNEGVQHLMMPVQIRD